MPTAKALREQRAPLAAEIRRLNAEGLAVGADGNFSEAWVKVNNDYNALSRQIEAVETADRVAADQGDLNDWRHGVGRDDRRGDGRFPDSALTPEQTERCRALALKAWFDAQSDRYVDDATIEACKSLRFNPMAKVLRFPLFSTESAMGLQHRYRSMHPSRAAEGLRDYKATLSIGSGPAGGYLIPPETLTRELEINMLTYGGMRQVAETKRTATGERLSWPTADDTGNAGVQLGESAAIGPSTDPNFAKVYWDAYKFSSKPVLVPYELIQDSVFDIGRMLGEMFGVRLGRITNTKYTAGSGAATPMGLVSKLLALGQDATGSTYAKGYVLSAAAGKVTSDDILALEHSVDPAYRVGSSYMCHDQFLLYVRQLKDGVGRPLWQSNLREGIPDTLNGRAVTVNQDFDNTIATGKNVLTFGDHARYKIRTVGDARMYRLEERYRDTDQDGFIMLIREDGNLLTAGTAPVKLLQVK